MKPSRRWPQYSLRSFLVVVTALAVWLGVVANRAREQREAVKAIEALGGSVCYDWQNKFPPNEEPGGPVWLRRLTGDDFFQQAHAVSLSDVTTENVPKSIPIMKRLRTEGSVVWWL